MDGVYDKDPIKNNDAIKFDSISYKKVFDKDLKVMDMTAITMAKENNLPIIVYDVHHDDGLKKILSGEKIGTYVGN